MTRKALRFVGVTGAASGIGRELVKQYVAQGIKVVGLDVDQTGLVSLQKELPGLFSFVTCDLADKSALTVTLNKLYQEHEVPSIWINNAGVAPIKGMSDITEEELQRTMQVNFFALVTCVRFWLPYMETIGGSIVNIGSVAGHISSPGLTAYVASKFAVTGFTESLQAELELAKSPVKLILVSPGFVKTKIMRVGESNGFPQELLFLATEAEDCARRIAEGIAEGEKEIFPTVNGKAMMMMQRLSPKLARGFSKMTVGKKIDLGKKT
ncbi:MAG: SDR family NAD(P)-dependent oxidoreductase [Bdellovibrio sp.]|nr:SDR family NAD(P)-dependent oxidoreductase [Bdellovibrio sp.]